MKKTLLTCSALAVLIGFGSVIANAETVTTQTYVQTKDLPNINEVDFTVFDTNMDGSYSMEEVGERLFQSFDKDSNGEIDNMEWSHKAVMTITPMEKETFKFVDYNSDGLTDEQSYTYETFFKASGLAKFDENLNGLSAEEFIGEGFEKLDRDQDKMIDLEEWKKVYLDSRPSAADQKNYN